jgi:cytochrome c oxidase assembly protein subunit 15
MALAVGVLFQCLLGALVAGGQAGLVYNDWPLMNGEVFPSGYAHGGLWATLAHSQAAVQFNHRIVAYVIFAAAAAMAVQAGRSKVASPGIRNLAAATGVVVTLQAVLGVVTLMHAAPLPLAIAHQAGAAILLVTATALAWRTRRA